MRTTTTCLLLTSLALHASAQTQFVARTAPALAAASLTEVAAADFDGDGDIDIIGGAGAFTPGPRIRLFRNDGRERFVETTGPNLPALPTSATAIQAVVPIDIDADGDQDVFVSANGTALLWRNVGNLTFVDASTNLPANPGYFTDAAVADLDADGDLDLAASGAGGSHNQLFANQGAGTFATNFGLSGGTSNAIVAVDIDQDGDPDLVTGESGGGILVLRNEGNMVFVDVSATWQPTGISGSALTLAAGDVDGDGKQDLVVGRQNATSDLVLRNTGVAFAITGSLPTAAAGSRSIALVDVDEDGDLDLFRAGISAAITLAVNDGAGAFTVATTRMPPLSSVSASLVTADFDRDGDPDLLVGESFLPMTLLVNRHRDLRPGQPVVGQPWSIEVWSEPGYATLDHTARVAIGLAALPQPLAVPGFGELWLDLDAGYVLLNGVVPASAGHYALPLAVPPLPALFGSVLHVQALSEQARAPARFTAWFALTVQ